MTTIAWDGTSLSSDSQSSLFRTTVPKIHRLDKDRLFGSSGALEDALAVRDWLVNGGDKPKVDDTFHAIVVERSSWYVLERSLIQMPYERRCFSVGSGRDFAMAAMMLGKSAAEAVALAIELDANSGGEVVTLSLK